MAICISKREFYNNFYVSYNTYNKKHYSFPGILRTKEWVASTFDNIIIISLTT